MFALPCRCVGHHQYIVSGAEGRFRLPEAACARGSARPRGRVDGKGSDAHLRIHRRRSVNCEQRAGRRISTQICRARGRSTSPAEIAYPVWQSAIAAGHDRSGDGLVGVSIASDFAVVAGGAGGRLRGHYGGSLARTACAATCLACGGCLPARTGADRRPMDGWRQPRRAIPQRASFICGRSGFVWTCQPVRVAVDGAHAHGRRCAGIVAAIALAGRNNS